MGTQCLHASKYTKSAGILCPNACPEHMDLAFSPEALNGSPQWQLKAGCSNRNQFADLLQIVHEDTNGPFHLQRIRWAVGVVFLPR